MDGTESTIRGALAIGRPPIDDLLPVARAPRILLVEDSDSDATILTHLIREEPMLWASDITRVRCLQDALALLETSKFEAVVTDLGLPDSAGFETFRSISGSAEAAAVVVVTGVNDAAIAGDTVRAGAQDYIVKSAGQCDVGRSVAFAIRRQQVLDELYRATAEQIAIRDRFLSHVSHELRSPLSVVQQFTSLLLDGAAGPVSADQREFLTLLMRNIDQLCLMIDDLLDVSRAQRDCLSVDLASVQLDDCIHEIAAAYRPQALELGLSLEAVVPPLPAVRADARRVREVLSNLVENALRYTNRGGRILLQARDCDGEIVVTVSDTGRGIAPHELTRVFEQFYQSDPDTEQARHGLGLGLFVSKSLINRHGGRIWADSEPGHGTAVTFTIPHEEPGVAG